MARGLSLATLVSLLMGAALVSVVAAHVLSMNIWIERRSDIDQKMGATLIARETSRLIRTDFEARGQSLAPEFIQPLIHSQWIRDSDVLRISVVAANSRIVADTDPNRIGTLAAASWSASAPADRLREVVETGGQKTHIFTVFDADRREICNLVFQLSPSAVRENLYRALEAMLRLGIPLLLLASAAIVATGVFFSRRIVKQAFEAVGVPLQPIEHAMPPGGPPNPSLGAPSDKSVSDTIGRLEKAAEQLRKLAEK